MRLGSLNSTKGHAKAVKLLVNKLNMFALTLLAAASAGLASAASPVGVPMSKFASQRFTIERFAEPSVAA